MKRLVFILILLLVLPSVMAREGHTKLLAVKEEGDGFEGSVADLYLEVVPGEGRVFIETIPLTKLDTQISTRFAAEVACNYLDKDCSRYDFFYTIRADSNIIGGPSAGAATALLTISLLEDIPIDENAAVTGTINAGGMIGPVGGVKAKVEEGIEEGIKTILVPKGKRFVTKDNLTTDLKDLAARKGVNVVEVSSITDAFYELSGVQLKEMDKNITIDPDYADTMKELAEMLCRRSEDLRENISEASDEAINLTKRAEEAFSKKDYYSAASYCFGANVRLNSQIIKREEQDNFEEVKKEIDKMYFEMEEVKVSTISDLETYMIVRERLDGAKDSYNRTITLYEEGENYSSQFAYTIERIYSAESWSRFFGMEGKSFNFDLESMEKSCRSKISEAEERYQFAKLYFIRGLEKKEELEAAKEEAEKGNYELCLFKASKAKAEVDSIISLIGVKEDDLKGIVDTKLEIVKRNIAEQQEKGIFPIVGYSYYEYANNLKEKDTYSALVYSEYALELSNLDMYFKKDKEWRSYFRGSKEISLFLGGLLVGLFIMWVVRERKVKPNVKRKKSSKRKKSKK
ncbi:hypothetical protein GF336_02545 [Candidatus Woesearchaeota archaeon]|nr:hypothetical protein [Candidatus Woesearchaeota archaeon]